MEWKPVQMTFIETKLAQLEAQTKEMFQDDVETESILEQISCKSYFDKVLSVIAVVRKHQILRGELAKNILSQMDAEYIDPGDGSVWVPLSKETLAALQEVAEAERILRG